MTRTYVCTQFPERIGICELCGVTDHHLVEGVCPACSQKVAATVEVPSARLPGYPDVPIGAEADVRHAINGPQHIDCKIRCSDFVHFKGGSR